MFLKNNKLTSMTLLSGTVAAVFSIFLTACENKLPELRIASHTWPGYEFMFLAKNENQLPNEITLLETQSASESLQSLQDGRVDGAALTLDEVLRARAMGIPLSVVLVFDESSGADVVMAKPEFTSLDQLKGRRIGVERTALGAVVLQKLLEQANLQRNDVVVVDATIDEHAVKWENGELDALITYEPIASQVRKQGGVNLMDSSSFPDLIFDVLAVRQEVLQKNPQGLKALVNAHFTALSLFHKNPQHAAYKMAARLGVAGTEVQGLYQGLELPKIDANRRYLAQGGKLDKAAREIGAIMKNAELLPESFEVESLANNMMLPNW